MSITALPRSAWTNTAPGFPRWANRRITPSRVTHAHTHWPGVSRSYAGLSQAAVADVLRGFRHFHVNTRGWADIGYCYAIDQAGRVWTLAGHTHAAAHSATDTRPNENWTSMGILLLLGPNDRPTAAMLNTYNRLLRELRGIFPNLRTVDGHQNVPGASTSCPGPLAMAAIRSGAIRIGAPTTPIRTPTTPATPSPGRDWFDMATKQDLRDVINEAMTVELTDAQMSALATGRRVWAVTDLLGVLAHRAGLTFQRTEHLPVLREDSIKLKTALQETQENSRLLPRMADKVEKTNHAAGRLEQHFGTSPERN